MHFKYNLKVQMKFTNVCNGQTLNFFRDIQRPLKLKVIIRVPTLDYGFLK